MKRLILLCMVLGCGKPDPLPTTPAPSKPPETQREVNKVNGENYIRIKKNEMKYDEVRIIMGEPDYERKHFKSNIPACWIWRGENGTKVEVGFSDTGRVLYKKSKNLE